MPEGAALPKVAATEGYGADIQFHGSGVTEALVPAREFAERTGAVLIHPFDHEDIVAGQGTVGLEILEQCPDVKTILVPVGGGGLAAGIALLRSERPDLRIVGVQAEDAAAYPASLAAGHPVDVAMGLTMADGISVAEPGTIPFEHHRSARRGHHGQRGVDEPCADVVARARQDARRAGRQLRGSRRSWSVPMRSRGRSSRCSPAATSTRWCCSTSSGTVSPRRAGS